ncbi:expression-site associated gene, putative [Leishmania tarentolae]|uniref:Expression-site associated gene, putative n=1 Tax=Leishmania tarentolae TaxID=5689 RepID=A0A640KWI9_LEITA|nr:expression-site associated gene, putative [Leishmania tarentolae]
MEARRMVSAGSKLSREFLRGLTRSGGPAALTAAFAVVLLLIVTMHLWPRRYARVLDGSNLSIPYRSKAAVYREHAVFAAPLPCGSETVAPSTAREAVPDAVHRRSRRQKALEAEIDAYLQSNGIHRERPTRVRFLILSSFVDWTLCTTLGSAALAGVSIPVTGLNDTYSHIGRFERYLEFVEHEGLHDDDIVVTLDSDVFWTGADFLPFLKKFARFSPEKESDLDVAAVRAWEDYGEKKAPLYMQRLQTEMHDSAVHAKRPLLQMSPVVYNADDLCWWGQHSDDFVKCPLAFSTLDHMIEVARNHVSSMDFSKVGSYVLACSDTLRAQVEKMFTGKQQWMVDDLLSRPNAASPYTTQAKRSRDDPFFYNATIMKKSNPTVFLNGGVHVSRVWALRSLAKALATYVATETPVAEREDRHTSQWWCDQSILGQMYVRGRLYEIEHNLLSGPPLSMRTPPVAYDSRYGPPGLIGLDRRTEMAVLAAIIERNPSLFRDSGYLERHFPGRSRWWVWNKTEVLLGVNEPQDTPLDSLQKTRGGVLVTPPLLWRSATAEDRWRGFQNEAEEDPDVVHVPFIHYASPSKHRRFAMYRNYHAWMVAARHDKRARESVKKALGRSWWSCGSIRSVFSSTSRTCARTQPY